MNRGNFGNKKAGSHWKSAFVFAYSVSLTDAVGGTHLLDVLPQARSGGDGQQKGGQRQENTHLECRVGTNRFANHANVIGKHHGDPCHDDNDVDAGNLMQLHELRQLNGTEQAHGQIAAQQHHRNAEDQHRQTKCGLKRYFTIGQQGLDAVNIESQNIQLAMIFCQRKEEQQRKQQRRKEKENGLQSL